MSGSNHPWVLMFFVIKVIKTIKMFFSFLFKKKNLHTKIALPNCHNPMRVTGAKSEDC